MDFNTNPLTSTEIIDDVNNGLDLFTCDSNSCSLHCKHNANVDTLCTNCKSGCPIEITPFRTALECDQIFWIGSFQLAVNWEVAFIEKWIEFEQLITQDLAYFLGSDILHI